MAVRLAATAQLFEPPVAHDGGERLQLLSQTIQHRPGLSPWRRRHRQPRRIGRIEGRQCLGSVFEQHAQPGQLDVPVAGQGERDQLDAAEAVQRRPRRRRRAQQGELVWPSRQAVRRAGADAARIGVEHAPHLGVEHRPLFAGGVVKADPPRQPIDRQSLGADQLAQGAADDAQQEFKLKGAILGVAEADAEIGVALVVCLDVRNAPAVAVDTNRGLQARHAESALRKRQA